MKKSNKRLTLTTEALNDKGFRVRTSGIDLSLFNNNPIMLWMHKRPSGESRDEVLPLGNWAEIKLDGAAITAVPQFDDTDDFALKIANKVENGTIRMASAGLLPLEMENVDGQIWLTKSRMIEASIVDAGSNPEALAVQLYNEKGEMVTLSQAYEQFDTTKIEPMTKIKLSASAAKLLTLSEGAEMDPTEVMQKLVTLATDQAAKITELSTAKETAETNLKTLREEQATVTLNSLLDKAVEDHKITADEKPHYLKLGKSDLDSVKAILDAKPAQKSVAETLASKAGKEGDSELLKLSWDELDKAGKLVQLKSENPEAFKEKYKARFNTEYAG